MSATTSLTMAARDHSEETAAAIRMAREVGAYLRGARRGNALVKQPHGETYLDVTTRADLEAERMAIDALSRAFPHDHILSEETRVEYSPEWERTWIIDPLDGTTNYVKGLDTYAVSIAFAFRGRVVAAAVCLPATGDVYHAACGRGVFRNEHPLPFAGPDDTLAQSLVSVGFPHTRTRDVATRAFNLYKDLWLASSDLRRSASAVFDGCLLASGVTGAYLTPDIKPWDIAASSLFIEEQGGIATDFSGQPFNLFRRVGDRFSTSALLAKNTTIHAATLGIVAGYP
ncbi:MAG: myo-inositol-1(or 4)-monophosphatase [Parcubacteria group bacterium Gr01-1014_49]|nr:MAG: myo-inositol-1(or 4)-monophosphatase [Parcubacteria group bacterium Gr01-1014_49]